MSHNLRINLPCSRLFHLSEGHGIPEATLTKEKALNTPDFSMSFATRSPALFSSRHIFLLFCFVAEIPIEALLVALQIPHQIKLQVSFGLPNPIHARLNSMSVSDLFLLLSLECFLCSGLIRNILFICDGLLCMFCLTSYSLAWTLLKLRGGAHWKSTNCSGSIFPLGQYPVGIFQADTSEPICCPEIYALQMPPGKNLFRFNLYHQIGLDGHPRSRKDFLFLKQLFYAMPNNKGIQTHLRAT